MISVIVVCHDAYSKYLAQCLHSLENVLDPPEIIVVNNGSSEEVKAVFENYSTLNTSKICHIPNSNLATASNYGVGESSGDYIMRVDADDTIHRALLDYSEIVIKSRNCDAVHVDFWTKDGIVTNEIPEHPCGALFKRQVFDELEGYDETLEYQEGFDFWCRFSKKFKSQYLPLPLYNYTTGHGSMSESEERLKVRHQLEKKYEIPHHRK